MGIEEGKRRVDPCIWNSDYYMLSNLKNKIKNSIDSMPKGSSVFDYGCGYRPYENLIKNCGHEYCGGDLGDNQFADIVVDKVGHVPVADNSYDMVLSVQVLEHVEDPVRYLQEAYRITKSGGNLILSTHGAWTYHPYPTDYWRWTRSGLEKVISDAGFNCIGSDWVMGILAYSTMLKLQCMKGLCERIGTVGKLIFPCFSIPSQFLMMAEDFVTPNSIAQNNSAIYLIHAQKI